jgi:hypothetical protein
VWPELTTGDGQRVDWRVTKTEPDRSALRADLAAAGARLGPVTTPRPAPQGAVPGGSALSGPPGGVITGVAALAGVGLLILGFSPRARAWHYPPDRPRDLRVDLLRGVAIVLVVVNHLDIPSLYQLISQEALGAPSPGPSCSCCCPVRSWARCTGPGRTKERYARSGTSPGTGGPFGAALVPRGGSSYGR